MKYFLASVFMSLLVVCMYEIRKDLKRRRENEGYKLRDEAISQFLSLIEDPEINIDDLEKNIPIFKLYDDAVSNKVSKDKLKSLIPLSERLRKHIEKRKEIKRGSHI